MGEVVEIRRGKLSAKDRRTEALAQSIADYRGMDAIKRLRAECAAIEDAILSIEGHPRGAQNVEIQTERGFLLNAALIRLRAPLATAEKARDHACYLDKGFDESTEEMTDE